jgi:calcineurin-like phosphoesterase family protein
MKSNACETCSVPRVLGRRSFLGVIATSSLAIQLPRSSQAAVRGLLNPVRIGVIADLHHDIMHDGITRLQAFIERMSIDEPDAILQLGDFAFPRASNAKVIDLFNGAHDRALHVIGNHDMDAGLTRQDCMDVWGIPAPHYVRKIGGLHLLVLDGNDAGSPSYTGGYASYVGDEQVAWLKAQLDSIDGPIIVASHQPLAGVSAVDNADEIQSILGDSSDKVILAINGHTHMDEMLRVHGVTYLHVNSASYKWVGGKYGHESYPKAIHDAHPSISRTCPYRDPLFATLTIDPATATIRVVGAMSSWVGPSPEELDVPLPAGLTAGEQVSPRIRDRRIVRTDD